MFEAEDQATTIFRNTGNHLPAYMFLHPRRLTDTLLSWTVIAVCNWATLESTVTDHRLFPFALQPSSLLYTWDCQGK